MDLSASVQASNNDFNSQHLQSLGIDFLHVDLVAGEPLPHAAELRRSVLPLDFHVVYPDPHLALPLISEFKPRFAAFQLETLAPNCTLPVLPRETLGIAMSLSTPSERFDDFVDICSHILVMATIPGQSGGQFNEDAYSYISRIKRRYPGTRIHVDGGITPEVALRLKNLGVHHIVSGSFLFENMNLPGTIQQLKSAPQLATAK